MRPVRITLTPDVLDRNGVATNDFSGAGRDFVLEGELCTAADVDAICDEQTTAASAALLMNGAQAKYGKVVLTFPQYITVTSDGNDSGISFVVMGRKWDGTPLTETITGPNSTTSTSTNVWSEVHSISVTGATTGTISVGVPAFATFDIPRKAGVYSAGDDSGDTFTITGIDRYNRLVTDTIVGSAGAATTIGVKNFKYILAGSVGSATAGAVELGTTGSFDTALVPCNRFSEDITIGCALSSGASVTFAANYTQDDIRDPDFNEDTANYISAFSGKSASYAEAAVAAIGGVRFTVTSYASGTLNFSVVATPQV